MCINTTRRKLWQTHVNTCVKIYHIKSKNIYFDVNRKNFLSDYINVMPCVFSILNNQLVLLYSFCFHDDLFLPFQNT